MIVVIRNLFNLSVVIEITSPSQANESKTMSQ